MSREQETQSGKDWGQEGWNKQVRADWGGENRCVNGLVRQVSEDERESLGTSGGWVENDRETGVGWLK